MSVRSGQSVTKVFTTRAFATGVATDATGTPTGTLYVNGTADAASVTVTNITTGVYKAAVTLPTLAVNDIVDLRINATVSGVADNSIIWSETKDMFAGVLPDVIAGGAGGLFIAGSNAATTCAGLTTGALSCTTITASGAVAFQSTFAVTTSTALGALSCSTLTASGAVALQSTVTITGATVHTGNVSMAAGLTITQSTSNGHGISVTGNGTGHGALFTSGGGATGNGVQFISAATAGVGLQATGAGTGAGIQAYSGGGATGNAIVALALSTAGHGFSATGTGSGSGLVATGGGTAGDGLKAVAGSGGIPFNYQDVLHRSLLTGTQSIGDTTVTLTTSIGADDLVNGCTLTLYSSTWVLLGTYVVTDYVHSTKVVTLSTALVAATTAATIAIFTPLGIIPMTAQNIEDNVWNSVLSGHATAGTAGKALTDAAAASPTAAAIATAVWQDTTAGDFTTASSIGKSLYTSGVVPGGSGGLLISGTNSGTTTLGALTVTGATTHTGATVHTGNVSMAAGLNITQSVSNTDALVVTGNGTGSGATFTSGSGATGNGVQFVSNATAGNGLRAAGKGTGSGVIATSGTGTTGEGITVQSLATNGAGVSFTGGGTGQGFIVSGGNGGVGFQCVGGGSSGDAMKCTTTSGHGLNLAPSGSNKHGLFATGGNAGTSDGISAVAGTGGVPIRGDITGTITTVTTATNVTTVNGLAAGVITAASIAADAIGASELAADAVTEIAAGIWDLAISGHTTSGTTGAALNAAGSAGDPWSTPLPGAYGAGTAGKLVGDNVNSSIAAIASRIPAALVGGRMDASVGAMANDVVTASAIAADAIGSSELAATAATEIATAVAALDVDGETLQSAVGIIAAMVGGKVSGSQTGSETFKGLDGSTTRAVITVDEDGNRTAVNYP